MEEDFRDYNLLNSINDIKSRRALTLVFNDGQTAFINASVLIYLTIEYLNQKRFNKFNIDHHDGFMVKTPFDAEVELGIKASQIRTVYSNLAEKGFIQIKKQGRDNRTCIKVNLDKINETLNEYLVKAEESKNKYVNEQNQKSEARKARVKKISKVDIDKLNQLSEENSSKKILEVTNDKNIATLVYCTNHYYRKITNKTFIWKIGDLNTMLQPWRDRWTYKGAELGLAIAIYKAVLDKSLNKPFGLKVKSYFSIQPGRIDIPTELKIDNLLSA